MIHEGRTGIIVNVAKVKREDYYTHVVKVHFAKDNAQEVHLIANPDCECTSDTITLDFPQKQKSI